MITFDDSPKDGSGSFDMTDKDLEKLVANWGGTEEEYQALLAFLKDFDQAHPTPSVSHLEAAHLSSIIAAAQVMPPPAGPGGGSGSGGTGPGGDAGAGGSTTGASGSPPQAAASSGQSWVQMTLKSLSTWSAKLTAATAGVGLAIFVAVAFATGLWGPDGDTSSKRPSPRFPARIIGACSRSGSFRNETPPCPRAQSMPRLFGSCGLPSIFRTMPSTVCTTMPHRHGHMSQ